MNGDQLIHGGLNYPAFLVKLFIFQKIPYRRSQLLRVVRMAVGDCQNFFSQCLGIVTNGIKTAFNIVFKVIKRNLL